MLKPMIISIEQHNQRFNKVFVAYKKDLQVHFCAQHFNAKLHRNKYNNAPTFAVTAMHMDANKWSLKQPTTEQM